MQLHIFINDNISLRCDIFTDCDLSPTEQGSDDHASVMLRGIAFAHGAMGRRIDPSWGGSIELFLVPASAPRLV